MQCFLHVNECMTIGSVQINVLEVWHDSVKLGITNPNSTPSYTEEILYIRSDDDHGDDLEPAFEPIQKEELRPIAFHAV